MRKTFQHIIPNFTVLKSETSSAFQPSSASQTQQPGLLLHLACPPFGLLLHTIMVQTRCQECSRGAGPGGRGVAGAAVISPAWLYPLSKPFL